MRFIFLSVAFALISACQGKPSENHSELRFLMGSEWYILNTHHEELVRQASVRFNESFKGAILPVDKFNTLGRHSTNPLVRGNYLTDMPAERRDDEIDFAAYYGVDDIDKIFWSETLQSVHFMRDKLDGEYLSTDENCDRAVDSLRRGARRILESWHDDRNYAFQVLGHISHSVQDSASEAHVFREEVGNFGAKRIKDMCSFNPSKGHCNHIFDMEADNIWNSATTGLFGKITDSDNNFERIKPTAQHGVELTVALWSVIYKNIGQSRPTPNEIDAFIKGPFESFLKDPSQQDSGFFLCPSDSVN